MEGLPAAEIKFKDFPKFTNSDILNKEINNLFTLICNDFIASWFFMISDDKDEEFIEEIVKLIDYLIKDLETRLKKIDYVQLLLIDLPVVIKQHIKDFYNCKEKYGTIYSEGKSFEELFHSIQPHFALNNPQKESEYLRRIIEILVRNSIPEAEKNIEGAVLILREIMAKIVLENTIDSLSEPNFIYECITKILEDTPNETEEKSSDNNVTNEIITNFDNNKESNKSFENKHPNTFKRQSLKNNSSSYGSLNTPISFNNYSNSKIDGNSYNNKINTNEDSDYESVSEFSDSISRMIKLDREEEEGIKKEKGKNRLSITPGAFPLTPIIEAEENYFSEDNDDDYQGYINYFDSNSKIKNDYVNEEEFILNKNGNSNYSEHISLSSKSKSKTKTNDEIKTKENSTNTNNNYHKNYNSTISNISTINNSSEISECIIQTEPPPSFYSTIVSKLNFTNQSIQLIYNNMIDKVKTSYNKINSILDFVRNPFYLFTTSSEDYNDYQLYKPFFDVINLIFQFSSNNTWIWKKVYSIVDFFSYLHIGKLINRSLIRGVGWLLSENKVAYYMNELSSSLWPNGHFIESSPPPTQEETEISRKIAQLMMKESIPNSVKNLFGKGVIDDGFNRILEIFQNKIVNKHLVFILIDLIFLNLYPEHYNQLSNLEPKYIQKPLNMYVDKEDIQSIKGLANSQLEQELLTASNEPLIMPSDLTALKSDENIELRKRLLKKRSSSSINKVNIKRGFANSTSFDNANNTSNNRRRLKRVSNYIKYVLNFKTLNNTP